VNPIFFFGGGGVPPLGCASAVLTADSNRSFRPSGHNYQLSLVTRKLYIINRLFLVPFSNTYDDSFLVLGIASVFKVSLCVFIIFIVLIHAQMLIFHCSVIIVHAYTPLLCASYNK